MTNELFTHDFYKRAMAASNSKMSNNIIGGGYLPPKHREAVKARYGSINQMFKFRITGDEIAYKPYENKGVFGVICKIESPEDLKGIANYMPVHRDNPDEEIYDFVSYQLEAELPDEPIEEEEELNNVV